MFRGYKGVGLDGNNASNFLKLTDKLKDDLKNDKKYNLLSIVHCLKKPLVW